MRTPRHVRTLWLGIALSAAVSFAGCGRKESTPLSASGEKSPPSPGAKSAEAALDQQTEQKLDPLTKDDVELYLKVMHAAAERVKNPAPADKTALEGAKKILAGSSTGRVPTQDDVKTLERASLVALSMDLVIAEEMKVDGRTYRGIAEAIESASQNPALAVAPGKGGPRGPDHAPTPLEERLSGVNAANEKFLTRYHEEVQKLIAIVRNPMNLPKRY
jgi:hypothetical protein